MTRAIFADEDKRIFSIGDNRLYNTKELTQLFELDAHGVCSAKDRIGNDNGDDQNFLLSTSKPKCLLAWTRREDMYKVIGKKRLYPDVDSKYAEEKHEAQEDEQGEETTEVKGSNKRCKTASLDAPL